MTPLISEAPQKLDLERALAAKTEVVDITELEQAFVKVAAPYAASKGISAAAFRALSAPAEVLKKAGVK